MRVQMRPSQPVLLASLFALTLLLLVLVAMRSQESRAQGAGGFDSQISTHAQQMMAEGKQTFRFDTFGSEAFWGDALKLHRAIEGTKFGGVGPGVSPKMALAVGLKVDAEAVPASVASRR